MKHFTKRAISILLSLIMVLSVFTIIPLTASADTKTFDEAYNGYKVLNDKEVTAKALFKSHVIKWGVSKTEADKEPTFTVVQTKTDGTNTTFDSSTATITKAEISDNVVLYRMLVPVGHRVTAGYSYQVKKDGQDFGQAATVEDATSREALFKNALVAVEYGSDGKQFGDAQKEDALIEPNTTKPEQKALLAELQTMPNGTVMFSTSSNDTTNTSNPILAAGNSMDSTSEYFNISQVPRNTANNATNKIFSLHAEAHAANVSHYLGTPQSGDVYVNDNAQHFALFSHNPSDGRFYFRIDSCNSPCFYTRATSTIFDANEVNLESGLFIGGNNKTAYFPGTIYYIVVTEETYTQAESDTLTATYDPNAVPGVYTGNQVIENVTTNAQGNTWAFFGGRDVQGTFDEIGGVRNFTHQFEEALRWEARGSIAGQPSDNDTMTRYVTNCGEDGNTIRDVNEDLDTYLEEIDPQNIVYMVGREDYTKGDEESIINDFKGQLETFIDTALESKNGTARVIIQNPYTPENNESDIKLAKAYAVATNEVVEDLDEDVKDRVLLVNHNAKTSFEGVIDGKTNKDGYLNASGHLEIAKELCNELGISYSIVDSQIHRELEKAPVDFEDATITAKVNKSNQLEITSKNFKAGDKYQYKITTDSYTATYTTPEGYTGSGITTAILPAGEKYVLQIMSEDGSTAYTAMTGTVKEGDVAKPLTPEFNANQQKIADLIKKKGDQPITWLFMGDSITHGALHTYGYDSVSQVFEKYVKEDLNRPQDIVINTAVSSATTTSTLNDIEYRLKNYTPDVVLVQLGMNDRPLTKEQFKTNLKEIVKDIKETGAIAVLRTSSPMDATEGQNLKEKIDATREIAQEDDEVILADQYEHFTHLTDNVSYLNSGSYAQYLLLNNQLHPHANGQILMARATIEALGFDTVNSAIYNHWYKIPETVEQSEIVPEITATPTSIAIAMSTLGSQYGYDIGYVTLTATDEHGHVFTTSVPATAEAARLDDLPESLVDFNVEVTAYLKITSKKVEFAEQTLQLSDDMDVHFSFGLSNNHIASGKAGNEIGVFSPDAAAPKGTYTFTLSGNGPDNGKFAIDNNKLKVGSKDVGEGEYTISVLATNNDKGYTDTKTFTVRITGDGLVYTKESTLVQNNTGVDITDQNAVNAIKALEQGTIFVDFVSDSSNIIQSLISVSDSDTMNKHFHIYVKPDGTIGMEARNDIASNSTNSFTVSAGINITTRTRIAVTYDKEKHQYKVFANGALVGTLSDKTVFINGINGTDKVTIGSTVRSGNQQYCFGGTVYKLEVYSEPLSDTECEAMTAFEGQIPNLSTGSEITSSMFNSDAGNTWVFAGGRDVAGTYADVAGAKNYVALFEWKARGDYNMGTADGADNDVSGNPNRQRFVTNSGKAGRTLKEVVDNFDTLVAKFKPRAVGYIVGVEDYQKATEADITAFKTNLNSLITKGLALKNNTGFVVIQNPYRPKDEDLLESAKAYALAVNEVVSALDTAKQAKVAVVNHFNAELPDEDYNEDGSLSAKGHLAIALQLQAKVIGATSANNTTNAKLDALVPEDAPIYYNSTSNVNAVMSGTTLNITVDPVDQVQRWNYKLEVADSYTVTVDSGNSAKFENLPRGKKYVLTITSSTGLTQLTVMQGTTTDGDKAVKADVERTELQEAINTLVKDKSKPLTWLLMGDSITHGVAMGAGQGHDNIADMFRKFVREDLGRIDDTIVNTAVSSATVKSTLSRISDRLNDFDPDIVSVQLGTNDATHTVSGHAGYSLDAYKTDLKNLIDKIKEAGAIAVIRAPIVRLDDKNAIQGTFAEAAKQVAEANGCIFIDQYGVTNKLVNDYTYLSGASKGSYMIFDADNLHPSENGHILMARMLIDGMGLNAYNSPVYHHWYKPTVNLTEASSRSTPEATVDGNTIKVKGSDVSSKYTSQQLSHFTVTAECGDYTYTGEADINGEVVLSGLPGGTYTVSVVADVKTAYSTVSFESSEVEVASTELWKLGNVDHSFDKDTNEDTINATDATLVLQYFAKIITDETTNVAFDKTLADVSDDDQINATDATLILQYFAKIITVFPAEK